MKFNTFKWVAIGAIILFVIFITGAMFFTEPKIEPIVPEETQAVEIEIEEELIDPSEWFVTDTAPIEETEPVEEETEPVEEETEPEDEPTYNYSNNYYTPPATEPVVVPEQTEPVEEIPTEPPVEEPTEAPVESEIDQSFEEQWGEAAVYLAKTVWGEARGTSTEGQEQVIWCVLNRVDDSRFPDDITSVITQNNQFHGYSSSYPCTDEFYDMSLEVIKKWQDEKNGVEVDRALDPEYVYFSADASGLGNNFRTHW